MKSRRQRLIVAAIAVAIFWPVAFLLERNHLFDIVNGLAVAVGCGIVATYSGAALRVFRDNVCTPGHLLVVGIVTAWLAVVVRLLMIWIWRFNGQPEALINHVLLAFAVWLFVLGGALHLTARNAIEDTIPKSNLITLGLAVASGTLIGLVMIFWAER